MNYQDIKDYAENYAVPIMRTETSKLIADFIKENKPQNILEIGTAIGYSGLVMLENSDAELITIEHNKDYIIQANKNFKSRNLTKRVKIIDGDCLVVLANMICDEKFKNHFDIIFLDGPKAQYEKMLDMLVILLKQGGTLIVDDVLFHQNLNQENKVSRRFKTIVSRLEKFIEKCKNHKNLCDFQLKTIEDGIIFAKKG